jgi:hypothetical protein
LAVPRALAQTLVGQFGPEEAFMPPVGGIFCVKQLRRHNRFAPA